MKKSNCHLICSVLAIMLLVCSCGGGGGGGGPSGTLTLSITSARGPTTPPVGVNYYSPGESVTVSAPSTVSGPAGTRYVCTGWIGGSGDIPPTGTATSYGPFAITQSCTIAWTWKNQYQLTITASPAGQGTITRSPDITWYDEGTSVTLTANANTDFRFTGWSGNLGGTTNPAPLNMSGVRRVTANFVVLIYRTVTVSSPYGAPNPPVGETSYVDTDSVTVSCGTAPYPGPPGIQYACTGWIGGSGNIPPTGTAASYGPFTITQNCTITWTWRTQYRLAASVNPSGAGTVVDDVTRIPFAEWHNEGTVLHCRALPNAGYTFLGWSGGVLFGSNNPKDLTMNGPKTVMANFQSITYYITVSSAIGEPDPPVGVTPHPGGIPSTVSCGTTPFYSTFTEGFEQGMSDSWVTGGQVARISNDKHSGSCSIALGAIGDNRYSYIERTFALTGNGTVTFYWKVSSQNGDCLRFYIDGLEYAAISGEADWAEVECPLAAGISTLRWAYTKNSSGTSGSDCSWIDDIEVTNVTLAEGFEAGSISGWTNGGNANWSVTDIEKHSGTYSARSGNIASNSSSYIERAFTIGAGGGTLTFWWKVSSQPNGDYLRFYVDGTKRAEISGATDWAQITYQLAAGSRTLRWTYMKNASNTQNSDCGWIDDITVTSATFNEGFEAGITSGWATRGSTIEWPITDSEKRSGAYSARSGNITDNQSTYIERTFTIGAGGGTVTFWWKVSSQPDGDYLRFYVDGQQQAEISGETVWGQITYQLAAGDRTLRWSYTKNASTAQNSDCGWIDDIEITNSPASKTRYACIGWIDGSGDIPATGTTTSYTFTLTQNSAITWIWVTQYQLTTAVNPPNSGSVTPGSGGWYNGNSVVSCSAYPYSYHWVGWSGDLTGLESPKSVTMNGPKNVIANFLRPTLTVSNRQGYDAPNPVAGEYSYDYGTPVTCFVTSPTVCAAFNEGFEAGAISGWTLGTTWPATANWFATANHKHSGTYSARSGAIPNSEHHTDPSPHDHISTTSIERTFAIGAGGGTVAFWWKVSSQPNDDYLRFYIDGSERAAISSVLDWELRTFPLAAGTRTLKWTYVKGFYNAQYFDCGWIDDISVINIHAASASTRYLCTGYTGTGSCPSLYDPTGSPSASSVTFTITQDSSITWTWKTRHYLSVSVLPVIPAVPPVISGTVTFSTDWYDAGAVLVFAATANQGFTFSNWSGDLTGTENPKSLTMDAPKSVTANFTISTPRTVTVTSPFGEPIPPVSATGYPDGYSITISCGTNPFYGPPGTRYVCTGWTGGYGDISSTGNATSVTFTITQGSGLTWTWQTQYQLTTSVNPAGRGSVTPTSGNWYDAGTVVSCIATPASAAWPWSNWSGDLTGTENPKDLTMNGPKSITANFTRPTLTVYNPGDYDTPSPAVGTHAYDYNSSVTCSVSSPVFATTTGTFTEQFEGGMNQWWITGSAQWRSTYLQKHSGTYSARSGVIGDDDTADIERQFTIGQGGGTVTFWWKISSAQYGYLEFYINNEFQERISGEQDWTQITFSLAAGTRTLKWIYRKNYYGVEGSDCGWIDDISVTNTTSGTFTEGFEQGISTLWVTGANVNWYLTNLERHTGACSARSGAIGHSQSTYIERTFTVGEGGGTVTFWWKVSSQGWGWDYDALEFWIDGVRQDEIGGEVGWEQRTYSLAPGARTLRWRYIKDYYDTAGSDCGWIDDIQVTNTVLPYTNHVCIGWTGGSGNIPATGTATSYGPFAITQDSTITWNWKTTYRLTVNVAPPEGGTVTAAPSSPDGYYDAGSIVTLTASVNAPYAFSFWSGDLTGSTNPQDITMDGPKSVTANFRSTPYTLIVGSARGSPDPPVGSSTYLGGTPVTCSVSSPATDVPLTTLIEGFEEGDINGWTTGGSANWFATDGEKHSGTYSAQSGDIGAYQNSYIERTFTAGENGVVVTFWWKVSSETGYDFLEFYSNGVRQDRISGEVGWQLGTCVLDPGNTTLRWIYVKDWYVSQGSDCGWIDDISFTDVSPYRYVCTGWVGGSGDIPPTGTATSYSFIVRHNSSITWTWTTQYLLTTSVTPVYPAVGGTVTRLPAGAGGLGHSAYYDSGTSVQLTANPNAGFAFRSWSGDLGGTDNPKTVIVNAPRSLTADFSILIPHVVTVTSAYGEPSPPAGPTSCPDGYPVPLSCGTTPYAGPAGTRYVCTGWAGGSGNIPSTGTATSCTIPAITQNSTITWMWKTQYQLTTAVNPADGGSVTPASGGWHDADASIVLTAFQNTGFQFANWSGGLTGSTNPKTLIMNGPKSVTANFSYIGCTLTVTSAYGVPDPPAGTHAYLSGALVTCSVPQVTTAPPLTILNNGFETGRASDWTTGGDAEWYVTNAEKHSGSYSARSGQIGNSHSNYIERTVTAGENGATLTFWWKVSSEPGCDYLRFYIDGTEQAAISGVADWASRTFSLAAGNRTLGCIYAKNDSGSQNLDCGWIDDITVANIPAASANTQYVCTGWTGGSGHIPPTGTATSYGPFTITQNCTITWAWNVQHILITSVSPVLPVTGGSVSRSPNSVWYNLDTVVQLAAAANSGYTFSSWSGDPVTNPDAPETPETVEVTMDAPKNITANFTISTPCTVTVASDHGAPNPPVGTHTYPNGYSVKLFCGLTPYAGPAGTRYDCIGWTGGSGDIPPTGTGTGFTEEFELGNISGWTTGGNANWSATTDDKHSGTYSARSGNITDNQSTYIERTTTIGEGGGTLTFWWKASSEPNGDYLRFYVDGLQRAQISGATAWTQITYQLAAGNRTLRWRYEKNGSTAQNSDCGWIDDITVPAYTIPVITQDSAITWVWKTQYYLTTSVSPIFPASSGTVARLPDSEWYDAGTDVQLTATPKVGYVFGNWSGDFSSTNNPATVTMSTPKSITANFSVSIPCVVTVASPYGEPNPPAGATSYPNNSVMTVSCGPMPFAGPAGTQYVCTGWTGGSGDIPPTGTAASCTFTITQNCTITWAWKTQYQLTTAVSPAGGGSVTPSPSADWYDSGTDVQLTATANPGYTFSNWSGDLSGTDNPKTVTMNAPKSVIANFTTPYAVDVTSPYGAPNPPVGKTYYLYNSSVTVSCGPTPYAGTAGTRYVCTGYIGGSGDITPSEGTATSYGPFTITQNCAITWTWNTQYQLTTAVSPAGGGSVAPSAGWYDPDTPVQLTATANTGYLFSNWSGDLSGTDNPKTVTMDGPKNITANFITPCAVAVTSPYGAPNPPAGNTYYVYNSSVTVSCGTTPFAGPAGTRYVCTGWTGGSGNIPATGIATSYTFTITQNCTITWTWKTQFYLSTSVLPISPLVGGTVAPSTGWYDSGTAAQVTATPNTGYAFSNWSGGLSGSDDPGTVTMNAPKSVIANFTIITPRAVTVTSACGNPSPSVGPTLYPDNSSVTVSCGTTPYAGPAGTRYVYTGWADGSGNIPLTGTATSYGPFTITQDCIITWTWMAQYYLSTSVTPVFPYVGGTVAPSAGWYDSGTAVQLTATPNTGYSFSNWSGGLSGTDNPKTVTMDAPKNITANFSVNIPRVVTVTSARGSPSPPVGSTTYPDGYSVTVSCGQTPYAGAAGTRYVCTGWSGGSGDIPSTGTAASYGPFTITQNCAITWVWQTQYQLTAAANPPAGGSVTPASGSWHNASIVISCTATPNAGYAWVQWTGNLTGTDNPKDLTMDGPKSVTANFIRPTLIVSSSPAGRDTPIPPEGTSAYDYGASVTCSVTSPTAAGPNTRYVCTGWTGGSGDIPPTGTATSYTIPAITQNSAITWTWKTQYYLTTSVLPISPLVGGTVTSSLGWYDSGTPVQLTATPNTGYVFSNWSGDLSGRDNPVTVTMNAPKNITANFTVPFPCVVAVSSPYGEPNPPVGTITCPSPSSITLSCGQTPYPGPAGTQYVCTGWAGGSGDIPIGFEGFEAGNISGWTTGGNANWSATTGDKHSSTYSARSGAIGDSQSTYIERTSAIGEGGGTLTFWWKVSSETNGDYLRFYVDGQKQAEISGATAWAQITYQLAAGNRTLRWSYEKNGSTAQNSDCGWIDDITVPIPATSYTFTITQNSAITWTWKTQYQLTTSVNLVGRGSVTPDSGNWYDAGTVVSCSAILNAGWAWVGWSGDLSGTDRPEDITMDGPKSITANFTATVPHVVTVASVYGAPDPPVGQNTYLGGSAVTVSCGQTPYPGPAGTQYICTGWTGGSGDIPPAGAAASYTIPVITQDCTITWTWKTQYYLTTLVAPVFPARGGTVTRVPDANWYDVDVSVELTAVANLGFAFSYWSGHLTVIDNPAVVTMDAPKNITANFSMDVPRVVTVASARGEPIPPVGATSCPEGYPVALSCGQMPYPGPAGTQYVCTGWMNGSGDIPPTGATTFYTIPAITQNSGITWVWQTQYQLTTSVNPAESGFVTPPSCGWFNSGTVVSCNATAAVSYGFVNWSGDLTGTERPKNLTMNGPKSITANFVKPTLTVYNPSGYGAPNPSVEGSPHSYNYSASITCSVTSPWIATEPAPIFSGGFDAGNLSDWTTASDGNWSVTDIEKHSGTYSARSGNITNNGYSYIERTFTIAAGGGTLTFWWKVSSQPNGDYLRFYVNGQQQAEISGTTNWAQITCQLTAGDKTLRWSYMKNASTAQNSDCGWIDDVTVTNMRFADGFESGNISSWGTGGDTDWTVATAHSGAYSAHSGAIGDNQITYIERAFTIAAGGGQVTFWWKVGSEPNGDFLRFYVDEQQKVEISGAVNWESRTFSLAAGTRTLRWRYVKNASISQSPDCGWIDDITVTNTSLGIVTEGFESGTVTGWTTDGDANWYAAYAERHAGSYSAKSGVIYDTGSTYIETTNFTVAAGGGQLTFWWKVSSEAGGDYLKFYINGSEQDAISGEVGWESRTYPLAVGTSTLRWVYTKNSSGSSGSDCGWIDDVVVTTVGTDGLESYHNLPAGWRTSSNANWSAVANPQNEQPENQPHDGTWCARSGAVGNSGTTYIQEILNIPVETYIGGGTLTFWWKVSSEPNYDFLIFDIDGTEQAAISGETGWAQLTFSLAAGIRTLRWRYTKDSLYSEGYDCGWLDTVSVTATPNTRYVCTGYTGTGSCPSGTGSSVTFSITQSSSITWNWKTQHRLIVVTNPVGSGTLDVFPPSDSSYYDEDAALILTASAFTQYEFGDWSGDLTGTDNPQYLTMDTYKTVTANFIGPIEPANLTGTTISASTITWSWTGNSDWQAIAAGVLRTTAATLSTFQTSYGDLPESEPCPRDGSGNDRLLFEAADDLPGTPEAEDCPTVSAASAQTYTITYTRLSPSTWTCTADTDRTDLNDYYIDQTDILTEALSTGNGSQANSGSPLSPENAWFEIQDSAHLAVGTVYPNITFYQETGLLENTQYTRHVHSVSSGTYSSPTNDATHYTLVRDATTDDFSLNASPATNRTIGSNTNANPYPIDISYNYARCQMVYKASEIGSQPGVIARMRFQRAAGDADTVNNVIIYMVRTDQFYLDGWHDTDSDFEVYSGNLTISAGAAGTWYEIPLTEWFYHDGSNNIIITFSHQDGSKELSFTTWRTTSTSGSEGQFQSPYKCVAGASNTSLDPDVSRTLYRPNIQFEFGGIVTITITAPTNSTAGSTGVQIERSSSETFSTKTIIQPYAAIYTPTNQVGSGTWWYRIRFKNADGIESAYSPGKYVIVSPP